MKRLVWLLTAGLGCAAADRKEIDIPGSPVWTDTGVDLKAGDTVRITVTGTLRLAGAAEKGPEGQGRSFRDLLRALPVNEAGRGALIGRIGSSQASTPFLVGARKELRAPRAGRLFLGLNLEGSDAAEGSFHAMVEIMDRAAAPAKAPDVRLPEITRMLLDRIPRRVTDKDGAPGDTVNFLILGAEDRVKEAFKAAGWVVVDRASKDAVLHSVLASLSKQAYLQLPMSELYLFGRPQDYGYAHAAPVQVVAQRHHLRLWKAPFEVEGQTLWVGAATHDIGFDRDQRNGNITHKIDPDIDKEREFVAESFNETGLVAKIAYALPSQAVTKARTAHGEEYFSDGRTLLIYLAPSAPAGDAVAFAELFCSVLKVENPDGGDWGACAQWIEAPAQREVKLEAIANRSRVLIVPGILSSCVKETPPFGEGQKHLREKHGLTVEVLQVPNDPSESNARMIAQYLLQKMQGDPRKYIVLGYSKGAPDLQVALHTEPAAAPAVAAFITVAGAVGGSPIADVIPAQADQWIRKYQLPGCEGDLAEGFKSLKREARQAFLAKYPNPVVPTYSLPAVSDLANTSKSLQQTWQLLSAYTILQDGQVAKDDAIVPGAKYLGYARGDHFAVALPFEGSADAKLRGFADHNRYPRGALLEALVRFVAQDLAAHERR